MNRADSEVNYYCVASELCCFPRPFLVGDRPNGYSTIVLADKIRLFKVLQDVYCTLFMPRTHIFGDERKEWPSMAPLGRELLLAFLLHLL